MELVTVITANYNGSRFLARAIDSVLKQTYPRIEYVIVDDGSTDDSARIIDDLSANNACIKTIFLDRNQGVARARNIGIENATGTYITFLDADDMWAPEKIEKQVAVLERHPRAGLVVTDAALIDADDRIVQGKKSRKTVKEGAVSLYDYIAGKCLMSINAMTRRECLDKSGLFNPNYVIGEDYELWMRITREYEYHYLNEPLHRYRLHGQNATRDKLFNRESKLKILEEMVANNPDLLTELGRRFRVIMQRKYNSLGKAYYFAGRFDDAANCFSKGLGLRGSPIQRVKAKLWQAVLKARRSKGVF